MAEERPSKRTKSANSMVSSGDELPPPGSSSRTGLACEACRLRKTRCVGFPTCTWCQRRRQSCVRGQNSQTSPLDDWGNQILGAISRARDEILGASIRFNADQPPKHTSVTLTESGHGTWPRQNEAQGCFPLMSSAENILQWDVLRNRFPSSAQSPIVTTDPYEPDRSTNYKASANTSSARLRALQQHFETRFLVHYPIISKPWLTRCVRNVAESDGDWSAEACLVFLVCAIASLCDCSAHDASTPQTTSMSPASAVSGSCINNSRRSAYQYWTMAKRRLGWALDEPTGLLAAQCLCLAGFWHLLNFAPRRARNMFYRAIESMRDMAFPSLPDDERHLVQFIYVLSADLLERLNVELELSPNGARKDAINESFSPSENPSLPATISLHMGDLAGGFPLEVTDKVQQLHPIRKDINKLLASISKVSSWQDLHALLGQAKDLRWRLNQVSSPTNNIYEEVSSSTKLSHSFGEAIAEDETMQRRELTVRLLRVYLCLNLHLSPSLLRQLDTDTNTPSVQSLQHILQEISNLTNECLLLTAEVLSLHLKKWQDRESLSSRGATSSNSTCHNPEAVFSYRFTYVGCLTLLAVYYAKTKVSHGEVDFAHYQSLKLPAEWRYLVAGHTRMLLSHEEGTDTWKRGYFLSQFDIES
ncbi:glucose transport transcription regulator RGT1 [Fusarium denticulatum]|uniref:Glucose transport transcription regulator RGT1 n=1 Tax=Fusarium denticulatum TaxID=48507 RepID=A0A8H5X9Y7_9HYPO|nr:glucose transport transcription regulator RGT1 [Fusarium denticulatum]